MYSQSSHLSFHHSIPLSSNSMISSTIHYIHQKFKSFHSNNHIHQTIFNKSIIKFNYQSIVIHITSFIQSSLSFVGELIPFHSYSNIIPSIPYSSSLLSSITWIIYKSFNHHWIGFYIPYLVHWITLRIMNQWICDCININFHFMIHNMINIT